MAKILLIVAIVVSAATAVLGFMNQGNFKQAKEDLAQTDANLRKTQASLTETSKELADTKEAATVLETDKEQLAADLAAANDAASKAAAAQKSAEEEAADKGQQLTDAQARIQELEAERGVPQPGSNGTENTDLIAKNEELEAMVAKLDTDLATAKARVAELEGKEAARQKVQMRQGLEGQVLAVNPAWNFVVLSIGDRQGVVNNAELLLKRGNQFLGKVRVTSVEPSTSIADIVANSLPTGVSVQPGDSVIYQSSAE